MRFKAFTVALLIASLVAVAPATAAEIDRFVGQYIGQSFDDLGESVSKRDFDVVIKERDKGFGIEWTTFIHRDDGSVKKKTSSITFLRSGRPDVFVAAQKKDMFGNLVPHDPMGDEPYVWARISGDTLSVYGFMVMENGAYEVQIYHRTLTEDGMDLSFSRTREDGLVRQITGKLQRIQD